MRSEFQMRTSLSNKEHLVVGKDELIHQIAAKAGMNLKETNKVIDAFTEVVREGVAKGYEVRLMGFGTWNLRDVAPRRVKSIRGGEQITIPARKRVGFSVGAVLSQAAQGSSTSKATKATPEARSQHKLHNGSQQQDDRYPSSVHETDMYCLSPIAKAAVYIEQNALRHGNAFAPHGYRQL